MSAFAAASPILAFAAFFACAVEFGRSPITAAVSVVGFGIAFIAVLRSK